MPDNDGAQRFLTTYLQDHHAGSSGGVSLAKRCVSSNEGTGYEEELSAIARQIEEDQTTLEELMARLDVSPSQLKSTLGAVAEMVARLKANGQLFGYSPLSRVLELEGLSSGIAAKRKLWHALAAVADDHTELDGAELEALIERATSQLERVQELHRRAAQEAFGSS